jgi:hypothetical protein
MPKRTEVLLWHIEIRKEGRRFSFVWLERGGIFWRPAKRRKPYRMAWKKFDELMRKSQR